MNPLEILNTYDIVLASKSPRRRQLLSELGLNFRLEVTDTDESFPEDMKVKDIPVFLAEKKAFDFLDQLTNNQIIITADTIVAQGRKVLNKPLDAEHAREMLQHLSGKKHQVYTGVCLLSKQQKISFCDTTDVWFRKLTDQEIEYYIKQYNPFDKAGAYGIQEWIGYVGISRINGSYFNVMGLPTHQLYTHLQTFIQ